MTLAAVHAAPDRAYVLTDSLRYTLSGTVAEEHPDPKAVTLPGLDAASVCAGDFTFASLWQDHAVGYALNCADFDEFVHSYPRLVAEGVAGNPATVPEFVAWLVGWSPAAGRFVAYAVTSADGFLLEDVTDRLEVIPAPSGYTPTTVEGQLRAMLDLAPLPDGDTYPVPADDLEWAELAEDVHADRAEALDDRKALMGGDVTLLELRRGHAERRVVHRFDQADRDRMLRGTIHPSQQLGPCICGSGVRMLDCHLPKIADDPCVCRSGLAFADCCRVEAPAVAGQG